MTLERKHEYNLSDFINFWGRIDKSLQESFIKYLQEGRYSEKFKSKNEPLAFKIKEAATDSNLQNFLIKLQSDIKGNGKDLQAFIREVTKESDDKPETAFIDMLRNNVAEPPQPKMETDFKFMYEQRSGPILTDQERTMVRGGHVYKEDIADQYQNAYNNLMKKNYQLAEQQLNEFLQQNKSTPDQLAHLKNYNAMVYLGNIYFQQKKFQEAIKLYEEAKIFIKDKQPAREDLAKLCDANINLAKHQLAYGFYMKGKNSMDKTSRTEAFQEALKLADEKQSSGLVANINVALGADAYQKGKDLRTKEGKWTPEIQDHFMRSHKYFDNAAKLLGDTNSAEAITAQWWQGFVSTELSRINNANDRMNHYQNAKLHYEKVLKGLEEASDPVKNNLSPEIMNVKNGLEVLNKAIIELEPFVNKKPYSSSSKILSKISETSPKADDTLDISTIETRPRAKTMVQNSPTPPRSESFSNSKQPEPASDSDDELDVSNSQTRRQP